MRHYPKTEFMLMKTQYIYVKIIFQFKINRKSICLRGFFIEHIKNPYSINRTKWILLRKIVIVVTCMMSLAEYVR